MADERDVAAAAERRCPECGSWDRQCAEDRPVPGCGCQRCLSVALAAVRDALARAQWGVREVGTCVICHQPVQQRDRTVENREDSPTWHAWCYDREKLAQTQQEIVRLRDEMEPACSSREDDIKSWMAGHEQAEALARTLAQALDKVRTKAGSHTIAADRLTADDPGFAGIYVVANDALEPAAVQALLKD